MHIEKTFRTDLTRCYSAGCTYIDGKAKLLLSSELEGPTRLVDAETLAMEDVYKRQEIRWLGIMSLSRMTPVLNIVITIWLSLIHI